MKYETTFQFKPIAGTAKDLLRHKQVSKSAENCSTVYLRECIIIYNQYIHCTALDGLNPCKGSVVYHFTGRKEPQLMCMIEGYGLDPNIVQPLIPNILLKVGQSPFSQFPQLRVQGTSPGRKTSYLFLCNCVCTRTKKQIRLLRKCCRSLD